MGIIADRLRAELAALREADRRSQQETTELLALTDRLIRETDRQAIPSKS